jgi:hypothetical protein
MSRIDQRLKTLASCFRRHCSFRPVPFALSVGQDHRHKSVDFGHGPTNADGNSAAVGQGGARVSLEQACAGTADRAGDIGKPKRELGDLDRIAAWSRVSAWSTRHPLQQAARGHQRFTDLIIEVFGAEKGARPKRRGDSRAAVRHPGGSRGWSSCFRDDAESPYHRKPVWRYCVDIFVREDGTYGFESAAGILKTAAVGTPTEILHVKSSTRRSMRLRRRESVAWLRVLDLMNRFQVTFGALVRLHKRRTRWRVLSHDCNGDS